MSLVRIVSVIFVLLIQLMTFLDTGSSQLHLTSSLRIFSILTGISLTISLHTSTSSSTAGTESGCSWGTVVM